MRKSKQTPWERFIAKIAIDASGCWLWTGGLDHAGYGKCYDGKKTRSAHRYAYEMLTGWVPEPDAPHLDHLCRVRRCCNPKHLQPVSPAENNRRGWTARLVSHRKPPK